MNLPRLQNEPAYKKELVQFTGYNNSLKPSETEYIDGKNLCSDAEPCLTQVPNKTYIENNVQGRNGMIELDGTLYYFCGTNMYVWGEDEEEPEVYTDVVTDTPKVLTFYNDKIIILPDQKYFDGSAFGEIENYYESDVSDIKFTANTIVATITTFNGFSVGDGVRISGSSVSDNNKTSIIRGISADRKTLTFDDNIFTPIAETAEISITREMPLMDFMVEHENRLWGCRGSRLYACKLGDFKNWNVFEGLSTDSYATDVGSPGDFTGILKTPNMVTFSKVDCIHKLYGNKPSNFEVTSAIPCSGVNTNCHNSICNIQGVAYYVSKTSVMRYAGGLPEPIGYKISREFDPTQPTGIEDEEARSFVINNNIESYAAAGTDGRKYYLSMYIDGSQQYLAYDTWLNRWDKIDNSLIHAFAYSHSRGALFELRDTQISTFNTDTAIDWYLTTKVIFSHNKKLYKKISVIADIKETGTFQIYIKRDNGVWELLGEYTLTSTGYQTFKNFLRLKRNSAFQLKIAGECRCDLYGIEYEWIEGSDK